MNAHNVRVALRADASVTIGLGHVTRCLALASALRSVGAEVRLVTRELGVDCGALAAEAGVACEMLPPPPQDAGLVDSVPHARWAGVPWQLDADQSIVALAHWQPDWVFVDHYAFDARWHEHVSSRLSAHMAAIDDLGDRELSVELLVDQNLSDNHRRKFSGRLPQTASLLGGPRFALLGPAYTAARPVCVRETVRSVGIFMGGVDAANLSSLAVTACREHSGFTGHVEVVITRSYPHAREVRALAGRWPDTAISADLPDLAGFFARHDMQIGAGGGASWERCCLGVPTLAIAAAANQDAVLPELAKHGAVALMGGSSAPSASALGEVVHDLMADVNRRRELSARSRALVDGAGARRIALRLTAGSLTVRPATLDDSVMMHTWRNHPATRGVSRDSSEISFLAHQEWLRTSLKSPSRYLLVGRVGASDVGVVRFDECDDDQLEVSLYLDPVLHGLGLGRAMLLAGEAHVLERRRQLGRFIATVLPGNESSARLFASCGYELQRGVWQKTVPRRMDEVSRI